MATLELPASKPWAGTRTARHDNCDGECLICGRPLVEARAWWVHMTTTADLTDEPRHLDSQGYFPVGAGCARRIPRAFRWTEAEVFALPASPVN